MKVAVLAAMVAGLGSSSIAGPSMIVQSTAGETQETVAKRCRYGSYVTSTGRRKCRRRPRPRGSH